MRTLQRLWPDKRVQPVDPAQAQTDASAGDANGDEEEARGEERYEFNPQLAVIESYALDVIGELSAEEIVEADDAVAELFGESRDWRRRVRERLGWNPLMDAEIADGWWRYRRAARQAGGDPDPAEFARRFADEVVRLSKS
jgi:hypothetical protein